VRAIHAAGVDSGEWPNVLEQLRADLDASVVTIGRHEFASGADAPLYESPADLHFSRDIAAFAARNPWYLSSAEYAPGRVLTGDEIVGTADLKRTDFYRGFLQPRGLLHRLCGVVAQRGSSAYLLSAYRSEPRGAFDAADKDELRSLLGHVALSLETQWRWQEADDLAHALLALSDHDEHPILLVSAQGEVVYRNPAAERLLDSALGLRLDGTRVLAASAGDQRVLREAISQAAQESPAQAAPRVVALAQTTAAVPMVVVVRAAGAVFAPSTGARRGLALVSVRGGQTVHDPANCAFAHEYQLTAAQAKVSALVFAGQPLGAIARSLGVSENTVRSHLRLVFQKTETHSQMGLVHLHARICASMP
jgi:DNA-binding CsgD family transcriptional regulator/PAS domain-containing protein